MIKGDGERSTEYTRRSGYRSLVQVAESTFES